MSGNQIVIDIEICTNCKSHQWCTRHDEKKYQTTFLEMSEAIKSKNSSIQVNKHLVAGNKIGAFEISSDGRLLYSKLDCGYFPHIKYVSDRVIDYINDRKEGKDLDIYDINSTQHKLRKSNQKYYDKLTKSSVVEKSPKKPQIVKSQKKDTTPLVEKKKQQQRTKEITKQTIKQPLHSSQKKEEKKPEKKQPLKEQKKEQKQKKEHKKEQKKQQKKQQPKEQEKTAKKQEKVVKQQPKEQPKVEHHEPIQQPKKQQPKEIQSNQSKNIQQHKQQIKQKPSEVTPPPANPPVVEASQAPIQDIVQQLPEKKWVSKVQNSQYQLVES